jgi:hypothetical protein
MTEQGTPMTDEDEGDSFTLFKDLPAIDPYRVVIAVDPGFYCLVPEAMRNDVAQELDRLRAALQEIANLDGWHDLPDAWHIAEQALEPSPLKVEE